MAAEDPNVVNPIEYDLNVTKCASAPSYLILIVSSVLIIYIVFKHYKKDLNLHFSVLFYIYCQGQFLILTTISWWIELVGAQYGVPDSKLESWCKINMPLATFSMILPGYAVLMITVVRTIFVSKPLLYFRYIRIRYQILGVAMSVILGMFVSSLPSMGVPCKVHFETISPKTTANYEGTEHSFCAFNGDYCKVYFAVLIGVGGIIPVFLVLSLYFYIYKITVEARKAHESLIQVQNNQRSTLELEIEVEGEENSHNSRERRRIPWSIVAILLIFVTSSTPWIILQVLKVKITKMVLQNETFALVFDLMYALVQFSFGCSTLIYLLTTNSLRASCYRLIKQAVFKLAAKCH